MIKLRRSIFRFPPGAVLVISDPSSDRFWMAVAGGLAQDAMINSSW
jgi:hypothetical protein